jgi:putative uncharacterized protein wcwY
MKKIALIVCYFGPFPKCFPFWLKTCAANPSVDFLVYTDQEYADELPRNVSWRKTTLESVRELARRKLERPELVLPHPYKLCDYKPLYGAIFEDDLAAYDFWGHVDIDLFLGNISGFITDDLLERYDKLLPMGHLSFYRNTPECNRRFFLPGAKYDCNDVLTSGLNFCFDEWPGIYSIYMAHGFPLYCKDCCASISPLRKRFSFQARTSSKYPKPAADYRHQVFFWENGAVKRAFLADGEVRYDEFIYIHLFRRKMMLPDFTAGEADAFFITPKGLIRKDAGAPVTGREIRAYNPYRGALYEYIESRIRRKILKRKNHRVFAGRELRIDAKGKNKK